MKLHKLSVAQSARRGATAILCSLAAAGMLVTAGPAHASVAREIPGNLVSGPGAVACAQVPAKARAFARAHHMCTVVTSVPGHNMLPQDTVDNDCGTASIFTESSGRKGMVNAQWGVGSTLGPFYYVALYVNWYNDNTGQGGYYEDSHLVFPGTTTYGQSAYIYTNSGGIQVWLTGDIDLDWGATCTVTGFPYAVGYAP
jgi:hypothetical protein